MKLRRMGALSLAAVLMATSTAIVAYADDLNKTDDSTYAPENGKFLEGVDTLKISYNNTKGADAVITIGFSVSPNWEWKEHHFPIEEGKGTLDVKVSELLEKLGVTSAADLGGGKIAIWDGNTFDGIELVKAGEETTAAAEETEAAAEETEEVVEEEVVEDEDDAADDEEILEDEDDDADDDADGAAEPNWVGATEGGTAALNKWISFEKLGGVKNKPCLLLCSEDDAAEPPADSEIDFKVSDVYGFVIYAEFDQTAWDSWHGGQIGTNSALGGWNAFIDYSTGNEVDGLTIDIDAGTITYLSDKPLFDQAEQDQGGYAHIWMMDWSNGDDAVKVCGMDILGKDGSNLLEAAPAPEAGNVDAATDSSKGSPDTGAADVAAVAGLAVVAAGAVVVAKKRK